MDKLQKEQPTGVPPMAQGQPLTPHGCPARSGKRWELAHTYQKQHPLTPGPGNNAAGFTGSGAD